MQICKIWKRPPPRDTSNHDKHSNNHGNAVVQSIAQRFGHLTFFWGCGANRRCNTNAEKPNDLLRNHYYDKYTRTTIRLQHPQSTPEQWFFVCITMEKADRLLNIFLLANTVCTQTDGANTDLGMPWFRNDGANTEA